MLLLLSLHFIYSFIHQHNYLTIISLEIHCQTRGHLKPDPEYDAIECIFYRIENNVPPLNQSSTPTELNGILIFSASQTITDSRRLHAITASTITYCHTEQDLLLQLVELVARWDPDIFAGYEIEMASWGYVLQRGQRLDMNLASQFSRIPAQIFRTTDADEEQPAAAATDWWNNIDFDVKLIGRIFLNVWRLMRPEVALTSYTFENVMFHVVHRRLAVHSFRDLSRMWRQPWTQWIVLDYYGQRVRGSLELLNQLDLIGRTCEMAKLFGIQFYEVLSRGSQFRVESMMLRIAKPKNVIPVSPSVQQRAHMRAPEYLPLILEPRSRLYTEPLIVLDFQSLYPSVIIAYNYCYSTCLGRVEHLGQ